MNSKTLNLPPSLTLFPTLKPPHKTLLFHQVFVLFVTFIAYASFHASRKPSSIVKSVLGPDVQLNSTIIDTTSESNLSNLSLIGTGWAPFNDSRGTHRLGELDLAFLSSYAIGMYFSGHFGDRIDMRFFLVFGMMGSGIFTIFFGLGYWLNVHQLGFFIAVQIVCGLFQSIGWPCVVAIVGNWFGKAKRGLIMGVWNSHTSVGNIIGSVVASSVLEYGWGWSFILPGVLIILVGVVVFMFLIVNPEDIGLESPGKEVEMNVEVDYVENSQKGDSEEAGLLDSDRLDSNQAIGFLEAWRLPGVASFAFCLFFSKLVAYTFLYWLPFYIRHTGSSIIPLIDKTITDSCCNDF